MYLIQVLLTLLKVGFILMLIQPELDILLVKVEQEQDGAVQMDINLLYFFTMDIFIFK